MTRDVTDLVVRSVAWYCLLNSLSATLIAATAEDRPPTWWWLLGCWLPTACAAGIVITTWRGVRTRSWLGLFGLTVWLSCILAYWAYLGAPPGTQPAVWLMCGNAVVGIALWRSGRAAVGYAVLVAATFGIVRVVLGAARMVAISEFVFIIAGGLSIAVLALGMVQSARAADALADRVHRAEAAHALREAVSSERDRVDRIVHDDVLTALTSAAIARDDATTRATAELASVALRRIDALDDNAGSPDDVVRLSVLIDLIGEAVRRITPRADVVDETDHDAATMRVPVTVAEGLVDATRELVRNAWKHAADSSIVVGLRTGPAEVPGRATLTITVKDTGPGFRVEDVGTDRWGLRQSVIARLTDLGGRAELSSRVGAGTTARLDWVGDLTEAGRQPRRRRVTTVMPAEFPADRLVLTVWVVVAVLSFLGALSISELAHWWTYPVAAAAVVGAAWLALRSGDGLTIPRRASWCCLALLVTASWVSAPSLPRETWPDMTVWYAFPQQLIAVVLVVRRRPVLAALSVLGIVSAYGWWVWQSKEFRFASWLGLSFGHVAFLVVSVLVARLLSSIAERQQNFRDQECASLARTALQHVGTVQRRLWVADVRRAARDLLLQIAGIEHEVPDAVRHDARRVEARLREGMVARNLMSEELASVADDVRERGARVSFIDSRSAPLSVLAERAVMAEFRSVSAEPQLGRIVVRLPPEGRTEQASVLSESVTRTHLTSIDSAGTRNSESLE